MASAFAFVSLPAAAVRQPSACRKSFAGAAGSPLGLWWPLTAELLAVPPGLELSEERCEAFEELRVVHRIGFTGSYSL